MIYRGKTTYLCAVYVDPITGDESAVYCLKSFSGKHKDADCEKAESKIEADIRSDRGWSFFTTTKKSYALSGYGFRNALNLIGVSI